MVPVKPGGRSAKHPRRRIVDAISYVKPQRVPLAGAAARLATWDAVDIVGETDLS